MRKIFFAIVLLLITSPLFSDEGVQKSLSVTIYNQNIGVVKDIRTFDLLKGPSDLLLNGVSELIDATSVNLKLNGKVIEQNYRYDLASFTKILERYIDKDISLTKDNTIIRGTLLSVSGKSLVLKREEGGLLMLSNIDDYQLSVPALPEGLITQPTLVVSIATQSSGKQDVELSYKTGGLNWHAEYVAVLKDDDKKMDLNAWVSLENNSGATYKNAKLKLIAGDINLVNPFLNNYYKTEDKAYRPMMAPNSPDDFQEKSFFEYHLYDLQRPTTLNDKETKQIALFESHDVSIKKKYVYYTTGYPQKRKVKVVCEFENKIENNMGMPMPKGKVSLYKADEKALELIGEDLVDHTPKNGKVELKIGDAFDITAEEKTVTEKRISDKVFDHSFEINFKNSKDEDVTLHCERKLYGYWEVLESSIPYEKKDANTILFNVVIPKNSDTSLEYIVRFTN